MGLILCLLAVVLSPFIIAALILVSLFFSGVSYNQPKIK